MRKILISAVLISLTACGWVGTETDKAKSSDQYQLGDRLKPMTAEKNAAYQEITWEALIPITWDPSAAFKGLNFEQLEDSDPRAQQALDTMRAAWDAAPAEKSWDGKAVLLPGFIIPLERKGDWVSELLLVPYFGACIHSPPPPANQTIHVVLKTPMQHLKMMDAFWAKGTLKVTRGDSGMGFFSYRLYADSLQPYEFEKTP